MLSNIIKPEFPLMDIEYDKSILDLNDAIERTLHESMGITVTGAADVLTASHYLKIYKHFTKKGEEIRKKCVDPFNSAVKDINAFFKKIYAMYSVEESRIEKELLSFNSIQNKIAEEQKKEKQKLLEEAAIQKAIEIEALQIECNENNRFVEIPEVKEIAPEFQKLSSVNLSGISTARIKKWRVTDQSIIPREYMIVNEAMVNSIRKNFGIEDASPIPGIEFFFETIIK